MRAPIVRCPTCQREVPFTPDSKFRPFCTERCKMVDLGGWFAEERRIAGEPAMESDEPAAPGARAE